MNRRTLLSLIGGAPFAASPLAARAQQKPMPLIGYLSSTPSYGPSFAAFRAGLAEEGYIEGTNVAMNYRSANGQYERLTALAAELVNDRVEVIVCGGGAVTAQAAKLATSSIPIVMISGADPVAAGLVASLSRPGGNITGVAQLIAEADAKRVELLHELLPGAGAFGYLENPTLLITERQTQKVEAAARSLGLKIVIARTSKDDELSRAFAELKNQKVDGLVVHGDPFFFMIRNHIVKFAAENALPTMYFFRDFVTSGGLISYGTRLTEAYRQVGIYTGRILKGARPTDLPIVQQSEKIELAINLKTAKALGLSVPLSILARADEVVE